ncbi:MAG TPA: hypothetical protein VFO94_07115 [Gammaproteobacteria bacterium]|nr:hypothetical protein [Gammaproteobacteria bacterium]
MSKRSHDAPAPGADDPAAERGRYDQGLDRRLDEALEETFPASDPIAVTPRRRRGGRASRGGPRVG